MHIGSQFHYGSIKTWGGYGILAPDFSLNSTMVRLKLNSKLHQVTHKVSWVSIPLWFD